MALPTTPFEDSTDDWAAWTTIAEEETFLSALDAASARVGLQALATTGQGRTIWELRLGYPQAPTDAELRDKDCVFLVGAQHGDEPSGREAVLQFVRDLAGSTDPSTETYLLNHPIVAIATANPDGRASNTRENSFGRDPNRQFLSYQDVEALAVGSVLQKYRPVLVVDCHEKWYGPGTDMETLWPTNTEIDAEVQSLASQMNTAVQSALTTGGFSVEDFPGSALARIIRNNVGLRNRLALLTEAYGQGSTDGITRKQAVEGQMICITESRSWHEANAAAVSDATKAADLDSVRAGREQDAISDPSITAPVGYELTTAQKDQITLSMERLRIAWWEQAGGNFYAPMSQRSKRLIPFLMDSAATHNEIAATALSVSPSVLRRRVKSIQSGMWQNTPTNLASGSKVRSVVSGAWL